MGKHKHKRKKSFSEMSDKDVLIASDRRSLMFSWVAYLEDETEENKIKYIRAAMKGIALVDEEMIRRGIGTCN